MEIPEGVIGRRTVPTTLPSSAWAWAWGRAEKRLAWDGHYVDILAGEQFSPDFLAISAGYDSMRGDPLGGFTLEPQDFATLVQRMRERMPGTPIAVMSWTSLNASRFHSLTRIGSIHALYGPRPVDV